MDRHVAETIMEQVKAFDPWAFAAYGAQGFVSLPENEKRLGGLDFKVNGRAHKGSVMISLMPNDTYMVQAYKYAKSKGTVKIKTLEIVKDVYCEQLVPVLDRIIEGSA